MGPNRIMIYGVSDTATPNGCLEPVMSRTSGLTTGLLMDVQILGRTRNRAVLPCSPLHVFFVIELATRRVEISGITPNPGEAWMMQTGRNTSDPVDGVLVDRRFLSLDGKRNLRRAER